MNLWKNYHLAKDPIDALQALNQAPGPARLIAGGTDLLLDLQQGRISPVHTLVDITAVPEMNKLEIRQERLYIGASVTLNRIVASPLVLEHAQGLVEACSLIGGPQVRNTATLGGNVAHALPAADGTIALLALSTEAEIMDVNGCRRVPLESLFLGPGKSALDPQKELLSGFYLPLKAGGQASAHRRVMRPQGVAIAILNMAIWIQRKGEIIQNIRLAVGPAGPTPFRAIAAEDALRGRQLNEGVLSQALEALLAQARFRTSPHRAGLEYRRRLAGVLLEDLLTAAWEQAA
jgi:xanthine dehydrogenase FAD-binding subunit